MPVSPLLLCNISRKSRRHAVTGNSDVQNTHCIDSRNSDDIDTTNSTLICEMSKPGDNDSTDRLEHLVSLSYDEVERIT